MLRIHVVTRNGAAPVTPLSAVFGEGVGSIGRDDANTLVLPDHDKHISRVQAQIKCLSGEFFMIGQGSNPCMVNGKSLARGNVVSLHNGDRIVMAEWVLGVQVLPVANGVSALARTVTSAQGNGAPPLRIVPEPMRVVLPARHPAGEVDELDLDLDISSLDVPTEVVTGTPDNPVPAPVVTVTPITAKPVPTAVEPVAEPWGRATGFFAGEIARLATGQEAADPPSEVQPAIPPPGDPAPAEQGAALLDALLQGLQIPAIPAQTALTPALARRLGALLRASVDGVHALRATRTPASAHPDGLPESAAALAGWLDPHTGEQVATEALQSVFRDLHDHQRAVAAGMQAALSGILAWSRAEASVMHAAEAAGGADDPALHDARIARLLPEEIRAAFDREFLRVYEEQMNDRQRAAGHGNDEQR